MGLVCFVNFLCESKVMMKKANIAGRKKKDGMREEVLLILDRVLLALSLPIFPPNQKKMLENFEKTLKSTGMSWVKAENVSNCFLLFTCLYIHITWQSTKILVPIINVYLIIRIYLLKWTRCKMSHWLKIMTRKNIYICTARHLGQGVLYFC